MDYLNGLFDKKLNGLFYISNLFKFEKKYYNRFLIPFCCLSATWESIILILF